MFGEDSRRAVTNRRNFSIEWGRGWWVGLGIVMTYFAGPVRVMPRRAKVQTAILSYVGLAIMWPLCSRIQGFADQKNVCQNLWIISGMSPSSNTLVGNGEK